MAYGMESVLAQAIPIPVMESSSRYLLWITATESRPSAPTTRQMPCVRRRESARAIGWSAKEKTKQTAEYIPKQIPPHCTPVCFGDAARAFRDLTTRLGVATV